MVKCIEGIYRNGKVELLEPLGEKEGARVLVAVLPNGSEIAPAPSLTHDDLAELRGKLAAWEDDWNAPGMEAYDNYSAR
jgi:predicted DNA-binding antitoxin AbrB/MazE fold protein